MGVSQKKSNLNSPKRRGGGSKDAKGYCVVPNI